MKNFNVTILLLSMLLCIMLISCEDNFLNEKPDKALLVPTTMHDLQSLLDNISVMKHYPALHIIASDNLYTTASGLRNFRLAAERNSYIWADNPYEGVTVADWNIPYQQVFYANIVLDGLKAMAPEQRAEEEWSHIKGRALFYRALAFYNLTQLFTPPYEPSTASTDRGIPIRLSADINQNIGRGTLQHTYDRIILDLEEAELLLPDEALFASRPTKPAAKALLARIYLSMAIYDKALVKAKECLKLRQTLINFSTLEANGDYYFPEPLSEGNDEVLYYHTPLLYSFLSLSYIDIQLYNSFDNQDLRRTTFFLDNGDGTYSFNGFYGITTAEMYLIKAECEARAGTFKDSMITLNTLLKTRWEEGAFTLFSADNAKEALEIILVERRKELINRGLRWSDLRRLNKEAQWAQSISRIIDGKTYTLTPNDNRYIFPIPEDEIAASGIVQNER